MKRVNSSIGVSVAILAALSACVQAPMGPTVAVMPSPNKPFEAFNEDQAVCRQFAEQQIGGAQQAQNTAAGQTLLSAGIGTLLGAGLGAAIGGGRGAAIGAAAGAVGGTVVGASQAQGSTMSLQQRYNIAYQQCMYSRGNQVPGYVQAAPPANYYAAPPPPPPPGAYPPPSGYPPPPPAGYPPPPPPPG